MEARVTMRAAILVLLVVLPSGIEARNMARQVDEPQNIPGDFGGIGGDPGMGIGGLGGGMPGFFSGVPGVGGSGLLNPPSLELGGGPGLLNPFLGFGGIPGIGGATPRAAQPDLMHRSSTP